MALTGRRFGRENSRALNRDAIGTILFLAAGLPVFTEREYTVVAGTVVDVFDLSDQTRTHVVTQADPAKQVLPPAMHANFLRPCYDFTGAEWYDSNRTAAYWAIGHDGTGCGFYGTCTPTNLGATRRLINTRNGAANVGVSMDFTAVPELNYIVSATSGGIVATSDSVALDVPIQFGGQYQEGGAPSEWAHKTTGNAESTGNSGAAPTLTATVPLRWGGRTTSNDLAWIGRSPGFAVTPALSAAQRSDMRNALQALYGVAA